MLASRSIKTTRSAGARPRDPMIDLTTLEGRTRPARSARCARRPGTRTRPTRPSRRSRRCASTRTWSASPRPKLRAPASTSPASRPPFPAAGPAWRSSWPSAVGDRRRRGRDRHGDRPRRLPAGRLQAGLRRDRRGARGLRGNGPPEGDPGDRRTGHARQRPPRLLARDAGRGRLHQDLDRQGEPGGDAAGDPGDAGGGPGLPRVARPPGRGQGGRRHPHREGRDPLPRAGQRDGRRRLAGPRPVPARRLQPAERPADAADASWPPARTPAPTTSRDWTRNGKASSTRPPPSRATIVALRESYGLFIDGEFVPGTGEASSRRSARPPRRCWPRSPRPARPTSTAP